MSLSLEFYKNSDANDYALEAEIIRSMAIDEAFPKRTKSGPWTVKELSQNGEIDLMKYIILNVDAYKISAREQVNATAYRIPQREVGYLSQEQIEAGYSSCTDNLQQCVAVIVDGLDRGSGKRLLALAHVDKYTTPESLEEVFGHFKKDETISIKLHGARDQGRQKDVSSDNLAMVCGVIEKCGLTHRVAEHKAGVPSTHHNIIYNPQTQAIIEDQYPNGGYQVAYMVESLRRAQNIREGRDFQQAIGVERNAPLRVRELNPASTLVIGQDEAYKILQYYGEHGMSKQYKELEAAWCAIREHPANIPECCSKSLEPFAQITSKAFQAVGAEVGVQDIYRDQKREVAKELYAHYQVSLMQQSLMAKAPAAAAAVAPPPPMSKDKAVEQGHA